MKHADALNSAEAEKPSQMRGLFHCSKGIDVSLVDSLDKASQCFIEFFGCSWKRRCLASSIALEHIKHGISFSRMTNHIVMLLLCAQLSSPRQ
jgi:hypothetical protein